MAQRKAQQDGVDLRGGGQRLEQMEASHGPGRGLAVQGLDSSVGLFCLAQAMFLKTGT